ncbi:MAG: dUTP diphosphatase [Oscillospiraceae bacterium]|nr:dUTP diphosphatase [Oscillospiraceae bacterium]
MKIEIKKLRPGAELPTRGSAYAAGYDLRACIDAPVVIAPGETKMVGTGLSVAVPVGYFGAVFARSGLASKQGLRPANCVGVCDSDYRGEYTVALHNDSAEPRTVQNGDRIAQLVVIPCLDLEFDEASELSATARGAGGFGSTGR